MLRNGRLRFRILKTSQALKHLQWICKKETRRWTEECPPDRQAMINLLKENGGLVDPLDVEDDHQV